MDQGKIIMEQNLPLRETTFFILLSLAPKSKHGYAIMKDVSGLSHGRVVLSTGTLYGALKRLLTKGWIERNEDTQPSAIERGKKTYSLTDQGRRNLRSEVSRLKNLVEIADMQMLGEQI
jgi:DNA-binding PadR family transcriptional regulator